MWKAIIKLIEKWGCMHKWESHNITNTNQDGKLIIIQETLFCKNCGNIKQIEL
jgi:hypothetical protein